MAIISLEQLREVLSNIDETNDMDMGTFESLINEQVPEDQDVFLEDLFVFIQDELGISTDEELSNMSGRDMEEIMEFIEKYEE